MMRVVQSTTWTHVIDRHVWHQWIVRYSRVKVWNWASFRTSQLRSWLWVSFSKLRNLNMTIMCYACFRGCGDSSECSTTMPCLALRHAYHCDATSRRINRIRVSKNVIINHRTTERKTAVMSSTINIWWVKIPNEYCRIEYYESYINPHPLWEWHRQINNGPLSLPIMTQRMN